MVPKLVYPIEKSRSKTPYRACLDIPESFLILVKWNMMLPNRDQNCYSELPHIAFDSGKTDMISDPIPSIRGPKLFPFNGDFADAHFIKLLDTKTENASTEGAHSRVLQVSIKGKIYAVKIFKFVGINEIRPLMFGYNTKPISDNVFRHQLDPFFAECRAFGLLTAEAKHKDLAVRCYGYAYLPESIERRIEQQFNIYDWNRSSENIHEPLRAIVKDYVQYHAWSKPSEFALMRSRLAQLNALGIYNMKIRKESYLNGSLYDFSEAITAPHIGLSLDVRTQTHILRDLKYDLACFDAMVKKELQKNNQNSPVEEYQVTL